jgi:epoxyqueuosine reductase QueG
MSEKNMNKRIKDFLTHRKIDLMGIAKPTHLKSVPDNFSPNLILKDAQAVICYGVPIPKGIIHATEIDLALYWRYCNTTYRYLDQIANDLCILLEDEEYLAVPIYSCYPWKIRNRKFWGLLPLIFWAERAGLGSLSRSGLLANPKYGTRILLGGIITNADLKESNPIEFVPCPKDCYECIKACPVHAIEETGKVNHDSCMRHANENPLLANLLDNSNQKRKFSFETILNTVGVDDHATYVCFECMKVCPLNGL